MSLIDDLHRAREAYERHEWVSAYDSLSGYSADGVLEPEDYAALATAAYLLGRRNDCIQALQRAFQANVDAEQEFAAARCACSLAEVLTMGGEPAVAGGWIARAQRILADVEDDVVERGYVALHMMFRHVFAGEYAEAVDFAETVTDYGRRFREPDLLAQGLNAQGRLLTHSGHVADGLRLLDESLIGVVTGEVSPVTAGQVYCSVIEACMWVSDFGRAAEWTHALTTWCDSQPGLVAFTGQCAVHRGQLLRLQGAHVEAVEELERAAERYVLEGQGPAIGLAHAERGDVLTILGDKTAAEAAYAAADIAGNEAQPGRSLLWLEQGRSDAAIAAIRRVVAEAGDPVTRSRLLPTAVTVLVAAENMDESIALATELGQIAESFGGPALRACAGYANGEIALALGDAEGALASVRSAASDWAGLDAGYQVARCRMLLGRALRDLGDAQSAIIELTAARDAFVRFGARSAERDALDLLGGDATPGGLSPRETEVLRLVATGKSNVEIAGELYVAEKTVARHLSNIFTKLDVRSRTAAAAFAYENQLL